MERHQHVVVNFLSHLGQVWVYASHKPEPLTTSMMISVGNVPPLGTKRYPLPIIASKTFGPHEHAPVHINWLKNQICVLGCMIRSHARNGNEFQTPGHRWLPTKHWDAWFLNSSKSKTRLKFMKLGMLSWSGINMPWYKFCPIWGRFRYMLLTNRSFSQQAWWFSIRTYHLWGWNDIHCLLLLLVST